MADRVDETRAAQSPIRTLIFQRLQSLRRPASTQEIAELVGRHPNAVRTQLRVLADNDLVETETVRQARGRPRQMWRVPVALSGDAHVPGSIDELARWLATALQQTSSPDQIVGAGRAIGRDLLPERPSGDTTDAFNTALTLLGYDPARDSSEDGRASFTLGRCPHRVAAGQDPETVCALHRGVTEGMLERIDPDAKLERFWAGPPDKAGCIIKIKSSGDA